MEEGLIVRIKEREERCAAVTRGAKTGAASEPEVVDGLRSTAAAGRPLDQGAYWDQTSKRESATMLLADNKPEGQVTTALDRAAIAWRSGVDHRADKESNSPAWHSFTGPASMLTVMLLSISFVASACEVQCDLKAVGPDCHIASHQAPSQPKQQMPPMAGMDHSATPENVTTAIEPTIAVMSQACDHQVCAQDPALLGNEKATVAYAAPHFQTVVLIASILMPTVSRESFLVCGSPPLRSSSPIALHTTLRV